MSSTRQSSAWQNWGRNVRSHPVRVAEPRTTAEVAEVVRSGADAGLVVKPVGAGHSFTPIAATDGVQVNLRHLDRLLHHDVATGRVTVHAGISLRALNRILDDLGLALPNLGDVDPQSVAGAVSTGTHGTGARLRGIAAAVVGARLVTGTGEVVDVDEQHPWFGAVRVGLGALGVLTEVTLQCVPAFLLRAREEPARLPAVLAALPELVEAHDHVEFYWFPHTDRALLKRNDRVPDGTERRPVGRLRHLVDDELLSNGAFELLNRAVRLRPAVIPRANELSGSLLGAREYVDRSHAVFVSPRRVRFRESEFAVPREALPDVIAALQRWFERTDERVSFPIEVRFAAADDVWLSTASERDSAYVAVHQYHRSDPTAYFAAAQEIFAAHDGRPHWGKMHTLEAAHLAERYPRFEDFLAVRDAADPGRTFANPYLERVLGA